MTSQTTALITAGPRTIGPWGDRIWRIGLTLQLVENSMAHWLVTPTSPPLRPVEPGAVLIEQPTQEFVIDALIVALASHYGNDRVDGILHETHNLSDADGVHQIAPYWELAEDVRESLVAELANDLRLGVTRLDDFSLLTDDAVLELRMSGFDVDEYRLADSAPGPRPSVA